MSICAAVALALSLGACGGDSEGEEFAPGNSQVSPQQVDAALGPADQTSVRDALPEVAETNDLAARENESGNSATRSEDDE